jgi:hypothetical protein
VRLGSYIALELATGAFLLAGSVGGALAVVSAVKARPTVEAVAQKDPGTARSATPAAGDAPAAAPPGAAASPASPASVDPSAAPRAGDDAAALAPPNREVALAAVAAVAPTPPVALAGTDPSIAATAATAPNAERRSAGEGEGKPSIYGAPDHELLAPLRDSPVVGCKLNYGGTSLSLRLEFQSGGRAAFKPDQIHAQSQPRREVAAYRIDRLLGIGHVPPAAAIVVAFDEMLASIPASNRAVAAARIRAESRPRRGQLRGAASWWIPEIKVAAIGKYPIDSTDGIVTWRRHLSIDAERTPEISAFVSQISDMVLFDFLIDNVDRWSGGNARTSMDGKTLYFMDNTLAFTRNKAAHSRTNTYLRRVKVFSRSLVEKVRGLDRAALVNALSSAEDGPLAPLLSDEEIDAVMARREVAVKYIDELIAEHGAERVLAFP